MREGFNPRPDQDEYPQPELQIIDRKDEGVPQPETPLITPSEFHRIWGEFWKNRRRRKERKDGPN